MIRFGQRVTLEDGCTPILRDFHEGISRAFVEHEKPVPWGIGGKPLVLGYATRVWVPAPGFTLVCDRDGCKIGMRYTATT